MAGSVPDVLAHRMLIDEDNTGLYTLTGQTRTTLPRSALQTLNSEGTADLGATTTVEAYLVVFPELRDLDGLYLGFTVDGSDSIGITVDVSSDTTTGLDGTWTELFPSTTDWSHVEVGDYRRYVQLCTATRVRAIRITIAPQTPGTTSWHWRYLHAFGSPSAGQNVHRVAIWDPKLDARVFPGYFDWGNVPLQSSAERTFRVKNLSETRSAQSIQLAVTALTDATPSMAAQHLLSLGGGAYAATVTIPSLAPLAISSVVTLRRITPSTAATGIWAQRLHARVGLWAEVPA